MGFAKGIDDDGPRFPKIAGDRHGVRMVQPCDLQALLNQLRDHTKPEAGSREAHIAGTAVREEADRLRDTSPLASKRLCSSRTRSSASRKDSLAFTARARKSVHEIRAMRRFGAFPMLECG